jgi:hypothetical protein
MNTQVSALAGRLTQLRKGAMTLAAGAVLGLSSFAASAVDVNFVGYTNGCFGLACVPVANSAPTAVTLPGSGLTFDNSTFNVTTSGGFVALGGTLGSMTLTGDPFNYAGDFFTLLVTFTAPPGAGPATFAAELSGEVTATGTGGLFVDFDNTAQSFTFDGGGSFKFAVNDFSVNPGETVDLSGQILAATVRDVPQIPEPETYALFMAGLAAVGFMARRRKH